MSLLDDMVKIVEQPGNQIIDEQGKLFSQQIKKYAQDFLKVFKEDQKRLEELQNTLAKEKNAIQAIQQGKENSSYEWRTLIENRHLMTKRDYYREMVTAALKFQTQINELLDQKVELVYVYQDEKNNPTLYTIDESSLTSALIYESNKGAIAGRFRQDQGNLVSYLINENLTKYELNKNFNLDYFNYTYKEIIWRFNYGHKKNTHLILWLNPSFPGSRQTRWLKAFVGQQGDIKEAYASVLLDPAINSVKLFNDAKLDNNVHLFMEELEKVDSESGLLKGDVTVGKIEYAIKGVKASTLGLSQIITLAQQICQKTAYVKQDLVKQKQQFHKKAGTRNYIKKACGREVVKYTKDVGNAFINAIQNKNKVNMSVLVKLQPDEDIISILQQ